MNTDYSKLLTIVVPAYNAENDIARCLDSLVLEQKYMDELEVLVVNDGSTDHTSEIAHSYERAYPCTFRVIDKENGNYGSCMNIGLSMAQGKYFRTLDSDDTVKMRGLVQLLLAIKETKADLIVTEKIKYYEGDSKSIHYPLPPQVPVNIDVDSSKGLWQIPNLTYNMVVMSMTYRTQLLRDIHFHWHENIFYTDSEFCYFPMTHVQIVRFVDEPFYVYYIGKDEQSTSAVGLRRNFDSFKIIVNDLVDDYLTVDYTLPMFPILKNVVEERYLRYFYMYMLIDGFKYRKDILAVDQKLKQLPGLYHRVAKKFNFIGHDYITPYRMSAYHPKYLLLLLYRKIAMSKTIRNILGKDEIYGGIA